MKPFNGKYLLGYLNIAPYMGPFGGIHAALETGKKPHIRLMSPTLSSYCHAPRSLSEVAHGQIIPAWIEKGPFTKGTLADETQRAALLLRRAREYDTTNTTLAEWEQLSCFFQSANLMCKQRTDPDVVLQRLANLLPDFEFEAGDGDRIFSCLALKFLETLPQSGFLWELSNHLEAASTKIKSLSPELDKICFDTQKDLEKTFELSSCDERRPDQEAELDLAIADHKKYLSGAGVERAGVTSPYLRYLADLALCGSASATVALVQNHIPRIIGVASDPRLKDLEPGTLGSKYIDDLLQQFNAFHEAMIDLPITYPERAKLLKQIEVFSRSIKLITAIAVMETLKGLSVKNRTSLMQSVLEANFNREEFWSAMQDCFAKLSTDTINAEGMEGTLVVWGKAIAE